MRLKSTIDFDGNTGDGKVLNWHIEPYRLEDDLSEVYVHVVDDETDNVVFEMTLEEWLRIGEAVTIANKAEIDILNLDSTRVKA